MDFFETSTFDDPPSKPERIFLGLIREPGIGDYAGRAAQLTDEELRALFAVAQAALREADRRAVGHKSHSSSARPSHAPPALPAEVKPGKRPGVRAVKETP